MSFVSIVLKQPGRLLDLPKPVWLLGWVSLATDSATEAIYPLLPFFLTRVLGAGAVSLGIVEGAAEAVNSVLKIISGRIADRSRRKRPLVLFGYSVSSIARPFIAVTTTWTQVFVVRVLDRVGKGVRGAPRDAMLAMWATPTTRGKVYGFHRAMDHTGAVIGPTLASVFLFFYPGEYRTLFALTIVPGAIAVALIFFVRERHDVAQAFGPVDVNAGPRLSATASNDTRLPRAFTMFMLVLTLFTLGNSTDAFLLLKLTDAAGSAQFIPLMWAALHVVKAGVSVVGGSWSDRVGRRSVMAIGWLMAPKAQLAAEPVSFAEVSQIIHARCLACHAEKPAFQGLAEAPKGVRLDTPERVRAQARLIYQQTALARVMPPGNITGMTEDERALIARWARIK